jgi:hypothetical protein
MMGFATLYPSYVRGIPPLERLPYFIRDLILNRSPAAKKLPCPS